MFTVRGAVNKALVMIDDVDQATLSQIYTFLGHPAFAGTRIAIMADCHYGAGAVIGFTCQLNDYVIPNVVGVDIGCGIVAYKLEGVAEIDYALFDGFVRENIPSGFSKRQEPIKTLDAELIEAVAGVVVKTDQNGADVSRSIGTLGGGNHFIEIAKDEDGAFWLLIHTGSRNFGLRVAKHHQGIAKRLVAAEFVGASAYKDLEYLRMDEGGADYLRDMKVAQQYADLNRESIAGILLTGFFGFQHTSSLDKILSVHNYINFDDRIVRKGAISAHEGERVIIPLNMRDGTIVAVGKGAEEWNYSAPHGAGRVLSRNKAKKTLSLDEFQQTMAGAGVWTSCVSADTLDESPMAYKDGAAIEAVIGETVEVTGKMKPVYNFKAS